MLRYFLRPLPSRLVVLLLLLVGWRLAGYWLAPAPLTLAELRLQLLGERLTEGADLYRDLYTAVAPVTAGVAWLLDLLAGGRSLLAYRLLSGLLVLGQALYCNDLFNRRQVVANRSWLPALLYGLVAGAWFEIGTLTPLLLGQTFLLFGFGSLITTTRDGYDNRNLFRAGFLLGVAGLCHPPLLLFLPVAGVTVGFFAANAFRSFLLLLCGLAFPYTIAGTFYLYTGALDEFRTQHLNWATMLPFRPVSVLSLAQWVPLLTLPVALLLVGLVRTVDAPGSQLNYQQRFRQVMLLWVLDAILIAVAGSELTPTATVLWLPALAYFGTALPGRGRRGWVNEGLFLVAVAGMVATRFAGPLGLGRWLTVDPPALLAAVPAGQPDPARGLQGHTLLLVGADEPRAYLHNRPATPYFEWPLARPDFNHLNQYGALFRIRRAVRPARPAYLLDPRRRYVPVLQQRLPDTFGAYREVRPGVWRLGKSAE